MPFYFKLSASPLTAAGFHHCDAAPPSGPNDPSARRRLISSIVCGRVAFAATPDNSNSAEERICSLALVAIADEGSGAAKEIFTTAALEREPLPDGVRSSWGGQCRAGPQRK